MTPTTIICEARADGLTLALSLAGTIKATGDSAAVNRWLAVIREHKAEIVEVLKVGAGDPATASRRWLIHYLDCDPVEVACCPEATHLKLLHLHPDAVAAEPFTPIIQRPSTPLTASEEAAIREWLELIDETDEKIVAEVLGQCQRDADARDYFIGQALTDPLGDNRN
jgi:hypothetical protein